MAATPFDAEFIPRQICKTKLILFNSLGVDRDGGDIGGQVDSETELLPGELGKDSERWYVRKRGVWVFLGL